MVIGSCKLLNIHISKTKCYHSGIHSSLVMAHYTLVVRTCPTFPYLAIETWLNSKEYKIIWHVGFSGRLGFHHHCHYLNSLPVSYRINFKLSTLTYRALYTQQPPYLASLLHLSNIPRQLRSSISQLIVPKTKLNLGKRRCA